MAYKLKPYEQLVALTEDELAKELAPNRSILGKKRAELKLAEIEEEITGLERDIAEAATSKDLDLDEICESIDQIELLQLRQTRIKDIIKQLFP
jgi:hypothetical protein